METQIKQGEDYLLKVRVYDDSGEIVDINGLSVLGVKAKLFVNNVEQEPAYSIDPTGDEELLEADISEPNMLLIPIKREFSASYPVGLLRVAVSVRTDDPRFQNGYTQEYEFTPAKIIRGLMKE